MPAYQIVDYPEPQGNVPADWVCIRVEEDDGRISSWSWAPPGLDPAVRLNPDHPIAKDLRGGDGRSVVYRVPTVAEWAQLGFGADHAHVDLHRVVAAYAVVIGASTLEEASRAAGLSPEDLVIEAQCWAFNTNNDTS